MLYIFNKILGVHPCLLTYIWFPCWSGEQEGTISLQIHSHDSWNICSDLTKFKISPALQDYKETVNQDPFPCYILRITNNMLTRCGVKISNDNFNGLSHTPATLFVFGTHKDICE